MSPVRHLSGPHQDRRITVTPETAGWRTLGVDVVGLAAGETEVLDSGDTEGAIVIVAGRLRVTVRSAEDGAGPAVQHELSRADVFTELGSLVYVPPGSRARVEAVDGPATFSVGWAPAEPGYPTRVLRAEDGALDERGKGPASRRVRHLLNHPAPAHRLIVFEVHVPAGGWSGWPPHRHDGVDGSPYLEETYYFRFAGPEGIGMHCNYTSDPEHADSFLVHDGDLVLVPGGFHFSTASPGSDMYFLNFLAGDLEHAERGTPPCFDDRHTWIEDAWRSVADAGSAR